MAGKPTDGQSTIVRAVVKGVPAGYGALLAGLKERIREARVGAALAVHHELVLLYWDIGNEILSRQSAEGWGAKVVDRLAADLRAAFPDLPGLSPRNLKYMRAMAAAYPVRAFVQQVVARVPWGHNVRILDHVRHARDREWYLRQTFEHGWSRAVLVHQIESGLHARKGKALTNFRHTLPPPQSDLAQQALKDPYVFDFLGLADDARERDLERGLTEHVQRFLLELGAGFAFVGRQVHLSVGGDDFYLDLLFYHLELRCFVVVDLKVEPFKPEFAGKMNFYLSAVDGQRKKPEDNPTIGLLLCKGKDGLVVEYALRDIAKPIGVAEWKTRLVASVPRRLRGKLPTVEQLEAELGGGKP